ncbi:hypothetical protein ASA1KI_21070 [Opitutales bacterium ASA1]|uniref:hypothetical protein n=1 Tax=Congregicoccus parvus TaxID=3081749 RepID=UPI002B2EBAC3|nr:hypothetical protein ASA1KI_21070 [Opitutales bacterium ASA1]
MKAIVTIGYVHVLVADVKVASKIVELLSTGIEVHDELYQGKVVLRPRELSLSMKMVPAGTQVVTERADGSHEPVSENPSRAPRKALPRANQLRLIG